MGFSLGGPVVKDKVHFFASLRVHPRPLAPTREISWVPTPRVHRGERRRRPRRSSTPTAAARPSTARSSPAATSPAIVGTAAGAFNSLPAGPAGLRPRRRRRCRSTPAAATRRTTTSAWAASTSASSSSDAGVRPLRLPEPGRPSRARTRRARTTASTRVYLNKNHNLLGSLTHVFSPTLHQPDEGRRGTGSANDQPLNGDPQPTLYMNPTTAVRAAGLPHRLPGLPAVEPRQRDPVRRPAAAAAVLPGLQTGSRAGTTSASAAPTCT